MKDPFSRYVETATQVTRDTAERIVRSVLKQGDVGTEGGQDRAGTGERSHEGLEGVADLVRTETKRVISAMGLATRDDVERLERQMAELRQLMTRAQAAESTQPAGSAARETPSGTREAAKKTAARRTAKKADSGDAITATTSTETARKVATEPEATATAAERTSRPGEDPGSSDSVPVPEPSVVDVESQGTTSDAAGGTQEGDE